ncbi:unnamed protein product [Dovyalis caffra]|uniref:Uncharacterized protein n=1 Tax=Dovyalis caffra TaxID=77055 RepID=A0AAV1RVI7_9ROSI|nr:unnamed protein product [Dovyalis caffra]
MANPNHQPNSIENYPKDGEWHHLFRKKLTRSISRLGLICVGEKSKHHLQELKDTPASTNVVVGGMTVFISKTKNSFLR